MYSTNGGCLLLTAGSSSHARLAPCIHMQRTYGTAIQSIAWAPANRVAVAGGCCIAAKASKSTPAPASEPGATVRLNKRMAELGLCSRREADGWIEKGWVKVNGKVVALGTPVTHSDVIEVHKQAQLLQQQQVTFLINKPVGYVSGQAEDGYIPAVALIQASTRWEGDRSRAIRFSMKQKQGLAPAGRLDIDSTGLLVLTQDGRVARRIIGEDSDIDKEYLVRVQYNTGAPLPQGVQQNDVQSLFPPGRMELLRHGLSLDGVKLKRAKVEWQNPEQLNFVLCEGRKRQIRRMCEAVGLTVVGLKRVRVGRMRLGQLPEGQWRYLAEGEEF